MNIIEWGIKLKENTTLVSCFISWTKDGIISSISNIPILFKSLNEWAPIQKMILLTYVSKLSSTFCHPSPIFSIKNYIFLLLLESEGGKCSLPKSIKGTEYIKVWYNPISLLKNTNYIYKFLKSSYVVENGIYSWRKATILSMKTAVMAVSAVPQGAIAWTLMSLPVSSWTNSSICE